MSQEEGEKICANLYYLDYISFVWNIWLTARDNKKIKQINR